MDSHFEELLKQQKIVKDRVRGVVHGESNGMYLHGRPGTSKTYMIRTTLETQAVNYAYANGHLTPIGLFDLIEANQDRIIVLDDVASIFNQPIALQLLLAAWALRMMDHEVVGSIQNSQGGSHSTLLWRNHLYQ